MMGPIRIKQPRKPLLILTQVIVTSLALIDPVSPTAPAITVFEEIWTMIKDALISRALTNQIPLAIVMDILDVAPYLPTLLDIL